MSTDDVYLDNLDEFINDENKIVSQEFYCSSKITKFGFFSTTQRLVSSEWAIISELRHIGDPLNS